MTGSLSTVGGLSRSSAPLGADWSPVGFEPALHDTAIDALAAGGATSAVVSAPVLAVGLRNLRRELAERGLYGFDASPTGGPFRRVAIPSHPARVEALPAVVVAVAAVLPEVSFGQAESVGRSEVLTTGTQTPRAAFAGPARCCR